MAELPNEKSIAELVKLGRMTGQPQTVPEGNTPYAVVPIDCKVVNLADYVHNEWADRPVRKRGTIKTFDAESFCEYWTSFFDEHSRVFADETESKVLAVLDYHGAGANLPRWGEHRIELALRHSEEWQRWTGRNGQAKKMMQMDFAEFVEDSAPDIVQPNGATMLEVARSLSAKTDVDFGSAIRVNNGSVQFKYTEQVKGTYGNGNLEVPESFVIAIPVYIGCDRVQITARLRYRIQSGKLTFWYDLLRHEAIEREAFMAVRRSIAERLSLPIINGAPA